MHRRIDAAVRFVAGHSARAKATKQARLRTIFLIVFTGFGRQKIPYGREPPPP
jgi:hypothetical protein